MSRIRRRPDISPPPEWAIIQNEMVELTARVREAEAMCVDENVTRTQISAVKRAKWLRSRAVYRERFIDRTMSAELFDWIIVNRFADRALLSIWQKSGCERTCCPECTSEKDGSKGCICRHRSPDDVQGDASPQPCRECGCHGCATFDTAHRRIPETVIPFDDPE
jgi:bud site selection protein 31